MNQNEQTQKIYEQILASRLGNKRTIFAYSKRNKLCKDCSNRYKCMTGVYKKCSIRTKADFQLTRSRRLFRAWGIRRK